MARGGVNMGEAVGNILGSAVDAFNPVSGTNSFLNFVAQSILDPFVDIALNQDFAGRTDCARY